MSLDQVLAKLDEISSRLDRLESGGAKAPAGGAAQVVNNDNNAPAGGDAGAARVTALREIIDSQVVAWVELAGKLGPEVEAVSKKILAVAEENYNLVKEASLAKKPAASDLAPIFAPLSKAIMAVGEYRDQNRANREAGNHLFAAAESSSIFGWVAVPNTPMSYAKEFIGSAQFYTNKVLKEFKGKSEEQVAWAKGYIAILQSLVPYIKEHHMTGLSWNPKGRKAAVPSAGEEKAEEKKVEKVVKKAPTKVKGNQAGLFSELNKGGAVTGGLKKVTRDMTNKDKKVSSVVKAKKVVSREQKPKKDAVCTLNGNKWIVEWYFNPTAPIYIKDVQKNQTVYIFKCTGATIVIEGKVNSICVDGCKKTGVVFDDAVATCEVVNCQSVKVQAKGKVPAVSIDKSGGVQLYLSKEGLATEIITSTSSEMNVVLPPLNADDPMADPVELPLPEQFKSVIKDYKVQTNQVDHSGG